MRSSIATVPACLALLGCSEQIQPTPSEHSEPVVSRLATPTAPDAPAFIHRQAVSLFHLGSNLSSRNDMGMDKVVGDEGVFATDPRTGAVRAILNGGASAARVPGLAGTAAVHNERVKAYFLRAGLPADQIGDTQVMTQMEGGGPPGVIEGGRSATFVSYTTVITRVVQGVPVPDSFAVARFNKNDETTMEWVYWPSIPGSIIDDAKKLSALLGDAHARSAYVDKLPPEVARNSQAEVTIRHSDFADPKFTTFASYDVHEGPQAGRSRGRTRNFDSAGNELVHPNRRPNDVPVPSSAAKP
jgi:hypothetical protein